MNNSQSVAVYICGDAAAKLTATLFFDHNFCKY